MMRGDNPKGMSELEWEESEKLVGVISLCVLHQCLFQQASLDKKFIRSLWDSHKKVAVIFLN